MRTQILVALLSAAAAVLGGPNTLITPENAPCLGDNDDYDSTCLRAFSDENNLRCVMGLNIQPLGRVPPIRYDDDYNIADINAAAKEMAENPKDKEKTRYFYQTFGKAARWIWKKLEKPGEKIATHFEEKTLPPLEHFGGMLHEMWDADSKAEVKEALHKAYPGKRGKLRMVKNILKWTGLIAVGIVTFALTLEILLDLLFATAIIWVPTACVAVGSWVLHSSSTIGR